jgi:hypothetical protein
MVLESVYLPVWTLAVAAVLVAFLVPVRCAAPIGKPPFRGCRLRVSGMFGKCRHHGRRPDLRVMATFGGQGLIRRRTCDRCGQPRVFVRRRDNGRSFLGCTGFPVCQNSRYLGEWR